jgi:hypothetical protein
LPGLGGNEGVLRRQVHVEDGDCHCGGQPQRGQRSEEAEDQRDAAAKFSAGRRGLQKSGEHVACPTRRVLDLPVAVDDERRSHDDAEQQQADGASKALGIGGEVGHVRPPAKM